MNAKFKKLSAVAYVFSASCIVVGVNTSNTMESVLFFMLAGVFATLASALFLYQGH